MKNNKIAPEIFINRELEILVEIFPQIRIRYEYNKSLNTHFIEVTPNEIYHENRSYNNCERNIAYLFIALFGENENICFISDDDDFKIENPILELEGKLYLKEE